MSYSEAISALDSEMDSLNKVVEAVDRERGRGFLSRGEENRFKIILLEQRIAVMAKSADLFKEIDSVFSDDSRP